MFTFPDVTLFSPPTNSSADVYGVGGGKAEEGKSLAQCEAIRL
jgi:hypothetical protein